MEPQLDLEQLSTISTTIREQSVVKAKKRRVSKACSLCHAAHASCENCNHNHHIITYIKARPCKRCVERGTPDQCEDKVRKKRQKKTSADTSKTSSTEVTPLSTNDAHPQSDLLDDTSLSNVTPNSNSNSSPDEEDVDECVASNFLAVNLHISTRATEPNADAVINEDISLVNAFNVMYREKTKMFPRSLTDPLLLQFSQERVKSWKKDIHYSISTNSCVFGSMAQFLPEINRVIESWRKMLDVSACPTIIWDRLGTIQYVNTAYKVLTGFNFIIPTETTEFAVYKHVFSPQTVIDSFDVELKLLQEFQPENSVNAFAFKCEVRLHTAMSEKYIPGNMAVNVKLDKYGFAYLYIGTFFPTEFPPMLFKDSHKNLNF